MKKIKNNEYYTVKEFAEKIGVTIGTVYYWIKTRKFKKAVLIGNKKYLDKKEADNFFSEYSKIIPL